MALSYSPDHIPHDAAQFVLEGFVISSLMRMGRENPVGRGSCFGDGMRHLLDQSPNFENIFVFGTPPVSEGCVEIDSGLHDNKLRSILLYHILQFRDSPDIFDFSFVYRGFFPKSNQSHGKGW